MSDRGQTIQDYLLGVLLVLLTTAAVFAFFPDVFIPFEQADQQENKKMAERLADEVINVSMTVRGEQTVNLTSLERAVQDSDNFALIVNRSGIPHWKQVNVTVQDENRDILVAGESDTVGSVYREGRSTGTQVRHIQDVNGSSDCADGCQVIVRVW